MVTRVVVMHRSQSLRRRKQGRFAIYRIRFAGAKVQSSKTPAPFSQVFRTVPAFKFQLLYVLI
jgi:hypothetical protein